MDDVYEMLLTNKVGEESFSDELRRVLTRRNARPLKAYFGIISKEKGRGMLLDLEMIKKKELIKLRERINETS